MKKILAILLSVCMLIPFFSGCSRMRSLTIVKDNAFTVIYDTDTVSTKALREFSNALEEATGVDVRPSKTDEPVKGAILLGNVILPDGTRAAGDLRSKDYKVGIQGDYYLIGGPNADATDEAVDHFIESVLPSLKDGKLKVKAKNDTVMAAEYRTRQITIGNISPGQYSIVIPKNPSVSELRMAVELREYLAGSLGYELLVTDEKSIKTTAQIRVGQDLCKSATAANAHDFAIAVSGTTMEITAESYLGYAAALNELKNTIFTTRDDGPEITDGSAWSGNGEALASHPLTSTGDIRVMFNNIHGQIADGDKPMPVEQPTQMLTEMYLEYLPDVIGLQECTSHSYNAGIIDMLSSEYAMTGDKTDTPIFYRRSTVELLANGDCRFMASDSGIDYGNVRPNDSGRSKGVTWAIFKVKATGEIFAVGSTHLWWKHDSAADETARSLQMKRIVEVMTTAVNDFVQGTQLSAESIPILVGGDYNTRYVGDKHGPTMLKSDAIGPFKNANDLAQSKNTKSTIHGYALYNQETGIYDTPQKAGGTYDNALDHIMIANSSAVTVNRVCVIDELYSSLSTDHHPIFADITFK